MPRLRRAAWRSIRVATGGAFIGGVAVFGVQHGLTLISARYPPLVQAMQCEAPDTQEAEGMLCSAAPRRPGSAWGRRIPASCCPPSPPGRR